MSTMHKNASRRALLTASVAVACIFSGCATFGLDAADVTAYASVAGRVVAAVAKADQSRRVTEAKQRCGELEAAAVAAEDAETAATLLRELADAQRELADALEADAPLPAR